MHTGINRTGIIRKYAGEIQQNKSSSLKGLFSCDGSTKYECMNIMSTYKRVQHRIMSLVH